MCRVSPVGRLARSSDNTDDVHYCREEYLVQRAMLSGVESSFTQDPGGRRSPRSSR